MNDPSSAEGFTVIFNKARNEKKGGGVSDLPGKDEHAGYNKNDHVLGKPTVSDSISSLNSRKVKIVERITEPLIGSLVLFFAMVLQKKWFCCVQSSRAE